MSTKAKKAFFSFYEEDNDPIVHQLAKLALTTIGSWVAIKLIETSYNAHFGLNKGTDTEKEEQENNA